MNYFVNWEMKKKTFFYEALGLLYESVQFGFLDWFLDEQMICTVTDHYSILGPI